MNPKNFSVSFAVRVPFNQTGKVQKIKNKKISKGSVITKQNEKKNMRMSVKSPVTRPAQNLTRVRAKAKFKGARSC